MAASSNPPRIAVIGGTGATGREVVAALAIAVPEARIAVASRRQIAPPPGAAESFVLDVRRPSMEALARLRSFDLAVLALGPFHEIGDAAHRLCIFARLDCVDVMDCPQTARLVLSLDAEAKVCGVRVLTGMGMNPGLSTHLLHRLAAAGAAPVDLITVRLFAGGDEPAGFAATQMMLEQFRGAPEEYCDGRVAKVPADNGRGDSAYAFPGRRAVQTFHSTSAEPALLAASAGQPYLPRRVSYRMHCEGLPATAVALLRATARWRSLRTDERLARLFLRLHAATRWLPGKQPTSVLVVDDGKRRVWATGQSTFGLTSRFAAAVAGIALNGRVDLPPGVLPFCPSLLPVAQIDASLARLGVVTGSE